MPSAELLESDFQPCLAPLMTHALASYPYFQLFVAKVLKNSNELKPWMLKLEQVQLQRLDVLNLTSHRVQSRSTGTKGVHFGVTN